MVSFPFEFSSFPLSFEFPFVRGPSSPLTSRPHSSPSPSGSPVLTLTRPPGACLDGWHKREHDWNNQVDLSRFWLQEARRLTPPPLSTLLLSLCVSNPPKKPQLIFDFDKRRQPETTHNKTIPSHSSFFASSTSPLSIGGRKPEPPPPPAPASLPPAVAPRRLPCVCGREDLQEEEEEPASRRECCVRGLCVQRERDQNHHHPHPKNPPMAKETHLLSTCPLGSTVPAALAAACADMASGDPWREKTRACEGGGDVGRYSADEKKEAK